MTFLFNVDGTFFVYFSNLCLCCAWLMLIYYVTLFLMENENERMGIGYVDCSEVQYVVKSKDLKHGHWILKGNGFKTNHVQAKGIHFLV